MVQIKRGRLKMFKLILVKILFSFQKKFHLIFVTSHIEIDCFNSCMNSRLIYIFLFTSRT